MITPSIFGDLAFAYPWALPALVLAVLPLMFHGVRRHAHPGLIHVPEDWASRGLSWGLRIAAATAVALLVTAAAGPYADGGSATRTGRGAQIVIVFDRSGSMSETLTGNWEGEGKGESKIAAARRILLEFMRQRRGDMFGMVAFGSSPISVAPLTDDRLIAEAALESAQARSMGFTTVARALAMGLDYFRDRPHTAARLLLMVSDGGAEISEADRENLERMFAQRRCSLIWIYTRGAREPSVIEETAGNADSQSLSLHHFFRTLGTGYQVFEATSPADLQRAVDQVGKLTNLPTRYEEKLPRRDLAQPLYGAALVLLLLLAAAKMFEVRTWAR